MAAYRVLGPVEADGPDGGPADLGGAQRRAVLAQLILAPQRVLSIDGLCDGLWGDEPPPTAVKSVQVHVSRLRAVLPPDVLGTRAPGYLLRAPAEDTDLGAFERAVADARTCREEQRFEDAADRFDEALALWRGEPLADVSTYPFAVAATARLLEARAQAVEDRIDLALDLGRHAVVVSELERLVREEPLRERRWAQLMRALYRCGRQAEALEAFSRARHHLVEELGIEPGIELRNLERAVLDQDVPGPPAASARTRTRRAIPSPPPPDLRTPALIVGRDEEMAVLMSALDQVGSGRSAAVAVRGDEGMGKSALLAGFARDASSRARVVTARCREHAAVPYGPWIEIAEQLGAQDATELLTGSDQVAETPERHRLLVFGEVASALRGAAFDGPMVVVVVDDLHWSDQASADLLLHVLDDTMESPLLFLLAWRDRQIGFDHPVARLDHALVRAGWPALDLSPLDLDDIGLLLDGTGASLDEDERDRSASAIRELTGGVPLFTAEVVTTFAAGRGNPDPARRQLPETLRTLVARRLLDVGAAARAVADACAVIDEPMDVDVLSEVIPDLDQVAVVDALDRLVETGLVAEAPVGHGHAFVHGAFRRSILDAMRSGRRQKLHAAAYAAMRSRTVAPELLVHLGDHAGPLVDAGEILGHVRLAAEDAMRRGAFADAHLSWARLAQELPIEERPEAMVADADAVGRAGDLAAMRRTAIDAFELVKAMGGGHERALVGAAARFCVFGDGFGLDRQALALAQQAHELVESPQAKAETASIIAYHHAMWGSPIPVTEAALAEAERLLPPDAGSDLVGGLLLARGLALLGSPDLDARSQVVDAMLALDRSDADTVEHRGRAARLRCLQDMSTGRLDELRAHIEDLLVAANESGSWLYRSDALRWGISAEIAAADVDAALARLEDLERVSSSPLAGRAFVDTQRMVLHWFRGETEACLAYLDAMLALLPEAEPTTTDHRLAALVRSTVLLEAGRTDEVREEFHRLDPVPDLALSACRRYPAELALCAELVAGLGLTEQVPELLERLAPFEGQSIVLSWGECILGRAEGYIAALRSVLDGHIDEAAFDAAAASEEAGGDVMSALRTRQRCERLRAARVAA